jgi:predicted permease
MTAAQGPASRAFSALLRFYPRQVRLRFGDAMRYAWQQDRDAARQQGLTALAAFWVTTTADACRFGLAERMVGTSVRGMTTVDWRDAWRALRAAPLVATFAVISLALGIGGVTALFSILNSITLKPLPVRDPARLVLLDGGSWTNPIWEAIRDRQTGVVDGAFAWASDRLNLSSAGAADMVNGLWVSGSLFDVLGVSTVLGRPIEPGDDVRGGGPDGPAAVISHAMWQRRFGGAPDVIGRRLTIEGVPFTIVGVAPSSFFGPDVGRAFDVAIPLGTEPLVRPRDSALDQRSTWWMEIMARLKPGQTPEQASALLRALQPQIRQATVPELNSAEVRAQYLSEPLTFVAAPGGRSNLRGRYQRPLTTILAVVGLVLLIACANIANLLIARASTRRHELTVRLALGASRWRIARQLLAESLLLATAGAALGVLVARWGSALLVSQLTTYAAAVDLDLGLDRRVLAFAVAVSGVAALLAGVAPALSVGGIAPQEALRQHGRAVSGGRRFGVLHASVVLQVALSLVLVVAAALLARTFVGLATRDAGFDRHGVLLVTARADRNKIDEPARLALFERFARAAAAVPGAAGAAASFTTPTASAGWNTMIAVPADSPLTRRQRMTWVNLVSPGWFATIGVPMNAGRDFDARDRAGAPRVVIVNRAFARRFLGGQTLGAVVTTIEPGPKTKPPPRLEVVGIVDDMIYRSLRAPMEPIMYYPLAQSEDLGTSIVISVRAATGRPEALARSVAAAIAREDPSAVLSIRTLDEQVAASLTQERLVATLASFFGILGMLLAALGLYGVTSAAVTARRSEIGIRMALGARADGVVRLVLRGVAWMVGIGIVAGAALSAWAATFTQSLLYDVQPRDPLTFASAALTLIAVATIAAWLPARRASRISPIDTLRRL